MQAPRIPCTKSHVPSLLLKLYQRISPSPRHMFSFHNSSWWTKPCRLPATAYSLYTYSQLPSILEAFLHPQPEDAPCRGDWCPLIMVSISITFLKTRFLTVKAFALARSQFSTSGLFHAQKYTLSPLSPFIVRNWRS